MSPNVALMSGAITMLALVLSIFGASWLNQRATERLVDQLEKRFDQGLLAIDQRLDGIERQLEAVFKPVLPPRQSQDWKCVNYRRAQSSDFRGNRGLASNRQF